MNKKTGIIFLAVIVVIILISALRTSDNKNTIKIGIIFPMTGNVAKAGEDGLNAIQIAQADLQKQYPNIELIVEDSEFSPSKTISAFNKLVTVDKVVGVIGGINSSAVEAVKPVAQNLKTVFLSPGGAASSMDDYVYKNSHEASKEGAAVAELSFGRGDKKGAVLYMDNDFGELEKDSFVEKFESLGGEIVSVESFNITGTTDYRTQLTKIKNSDPDSIFIVSMGGLVGVASNQIRELGMGANLYGISNAESSDLIEVGGESLEGFIYSFAISMKSQTEDQKKFFDKFKQKTGEDPQLLSYHAYSLYVMLAESATKCGGDPVCINEDIGSKRQFTGIGGTVTIDENNKLERPFYFRVIKNGEIVEVE